MRITATATSYSLACFTLSCFTLLPVTTDAFTPAVMSPLFVNNLPPQPADISSSNNNEQPYVPASLYTADSNDQRYSASDWYHNMMTLPRSSILSEIKGPVLSLTIWSGLVSVVHKILLNKNMLQAAQSMTMSSKPHSFLVSSIGLLLVFRTNSAYQRFAVRTFSCFRVVVFAVFCTTSSYIYYSPLTHTTIIYIRRVVKFGKKYYPSAATCPAWHHYTRRIWAKNAANASFDYYQPFPTSCAITFNPSVSIVMIPLSRRTHHIP